MMNRPVMLLGWLVLLAGCATMTPKEKEATGWAADLLGEGGVRG